MTESDIQNINLPDSEGVIPQIVFGPRNRESSWDRSNPEPAGLVGTEPRPERHNEQARKEFLEGIAERTRITQETLANRQANKPVAVTFDVSAIDRAVNALADAQDDFEATYLQPNLSLINARNEVERLRFELSQAEQKLAAIEAKGDSVTRLTHAVTVAAGVAPDE